MEEVIKVTEYNKNEYICTVKITRENLEEIRNKKPIFGLDPITEFANLIGAEIILGAERKMNDFNTSDSNVSRYAAYLDNIAAENKRLHELEKSYALNDSIKLFSLGIYDTGYKITKSTGPNPRRNPPKKN